MWISGGHTVLLGGWQSPWLMEWYELWIADYTLISRGHNRYRCAYTYRQWWLMRGYQSFIMFYWFPLSTTSKSLSRSQPGTYVFFSYVFSRSVQAILDEEQHSHLELLVSNGTENSFPWHLWNHQKQGQNWWKYHELSLISDIDLLHCYSIRSWCILAVIDFLRTNPLCVSCAMRGLWSVFSLQIWTGRWELKYIYRMGSQDS